MRLACRKSGWRRAPLALSPAAPPLALQLERSKLVIGLTVVAVGTSPPGLAASITSALRGHFDLAPGKVIGSNGFNILAVMSVPGIIATTQMEDAVFSRDCLALLAITLMLVAAIAAGLGRRPAGARLGRRPGALLVASYIAYYRLLFHH